MSQTVIKSEDKRWWKEATVYQVYPSSFADGNGDGLGDLKGITSKVDYLHHLGVDVLWLSPIYDSPQKDMGYDISDYRQIYAPYGTLEDWDNLRDALHAKGMKIMMDLVVNHTSDQHEWFKQSRSSKDSPFRDWYIWRPAKKGPNGERLPPNNWACVFGKESAWAWDEHTQEYYLHLYVTEQPDLNWDNPSVRNAVWDIMKFWLDRGSDGFRMDVINLISKTPGLPDAKEIVPGEFLQPSYEHTANGPNVHNYLQEMYREVLSKYDTITVGETPFTHDTNILSEYSLDANHELQMVFTFELHDIDGDRTDPMINRPYKLPEFKQIIEKYQRDLYGKGWNALYFGNHDQARSVSRFGSDKTDEYRSLSSKLIATMQHTLCGTTYIYQGEEIAMKNVDPTTWSIKDLPDVATQMYWQAKLDERRSKTGQKDPDMSDVEQNILRKARDNARAPVQWTAGEQAGFSTGKPWMRVNVEDAQNWNVERLLSQPDSVINYWRKIIATRKANPVLIYGDFVLLDRDNLQVFAYTRTYAQTRALVLLNFSDDQQTFSVPDTEGEFVEKKAKMLIGNYGDKSGQELRGNQVELRPWEARVYVL
ncbi:hypothetical protein OIV83_005659 [Microbotryomycetes sp. JL201]|nr:hypothetical protein OIV83_005659 [Microbotryomycetes sp. JL201]